MIEDEVEGGIVTAAGLVILLLVILAVYGVLKLRNLQLPYWMYPDYWFSTLATDIDAGFRAFHLDGIPAQQKIDDLMSSLVLGSEKYFPSFSSTKSWATYTADRPVAPDSSIATGTGMGNQATDVSVADYQAPGTEGS